MRCQELYYHNNFKLEQRSLSTILVIISLICIQLTNALPAAEFEAHPVDEAQIVVIQEDVIPDVDNTTQKIIRVNPLELPPIRDDPHSDNTDSELFTIKPILPIRRNYTSTKRMRRPRIQMNDIEDRGQPTQNEVHILRPQTDGKFRKPKQQQPHKKKQLHFLYNQDALDGRSVVKRMRVRISPGAYPVYYAVSKTNGRFGKYPIKGFSNDQDFMKYLIKSKLEPIELSQRYES